MRTTSSELRDNLLEPASAPALAQEKSWVEWYSTVGFVPILFSAMANMAYNAVEKQSWEVPAWWSIALIPQALNLSFPQQDTKGVNAITMIAAAVAVYCMLKSDKTWDTVAGVCFIPHVFTPDAIASLSQGKIDIRSARQFEGLAFTLAGISLVVGSPAVSINSPLEFLTSSLPSVLGCCVTFFGVPRFIAPFYEKTEEEPSMSSPDV